MTGDWNVYCSEGDLAAYDGWVLSTFGDYNANSNGDTTLTWNVTATSGGGLPTNVTGTAGISLGGGAGGHVNDDLSLTARAKTGDYDAGHGSKWSVELGWGGGSNSNSSYNLELAGDFATDADGELETTLTQDEFDLDVESGGNGNDRFRVEHDSKSEVVTTSTNGRAGPSLMPRRSRASPPSWRRPAIMGWRITLTSTRSTAPKRRRSWAWPRTSFATWPMAR